jgi:hypothetical protein
VTTRRRTASRTCRAMWIAFTASVWVASSRSSGYRPSIAHRGVRLWRKRCPRRQAASAPTDRDRAAWVDRCRAVSVEPSAPSLPLGAPTRMRRGKPHRRQQLSAPRGQGLRRPTATTAERNWCDQAATRILPSRIAARTTPGTLASSSRCAGSTTVMSTGTGRSRSSLSTPTEAS